MVAVQPMSSAWEACGDKGGSNFVDICCRNPFDTYLEQLNFFLVCADTWQKALHAYSVSNKLDRAWRSNNSRHATFQQLALGSSRYLWYLLSINHNWSVPSDFRSNISLQELISNPKRKCRYPRRETAISLNLVCATNVYRMNSSKHLFCFLPFHQAS